jgi:hypothetical protein
MDGYKIQMERESADGILSIITYLVEKRLKLVCYAVTRYYTLVSLPVLQ